MAWGFYGRRAELERLKTIFARGRWFFCKISGRRRIGKTALVQEAMKATGRRDVFYVQVPDSGPAGILSAVSDQMETFEIDRQRFPPPTNLKGFARFVSSMARAGYVVALDEFQYFHGRHIREFCSHLQAEVDKLSAEAATVRGGLVVLGSIHTEMKALLEDRNAPLYNRTTDDIELTHLDFSAIGEIFRAHSDFSPQRLLFFWTLFEGVPKFYRDCYEQGVLGKKRDEVLRAMFFDSSSPLRTEADNWFLREFRGRYDVVLKFIARHPGCNHAEIMAHVRESSPDRHGQVAGYIKILIERVRVIERRLPIFARPGTPKGKYYLADNFLRTWLAALAGPVSAINFRPVDDLVADADRRVADAEGHCFEDLVSELYEERSRRALPGFNLTSRIEGYWNAKDTEIDLVALDERAKRIRFGFCKREEDRVLSEIADGEAHIERFLQAFGKYRTWEREIVGLAPVLGPRTREKLAARAWLAEDVGDLMKGLLPDPYLIAGSG